jgi:hypothetical protein
MAFFVRKVNAMKTKSQKFLVHLFATFFGVALLICGLLVPSSATAAGEWTKLNRGAPGPVNMMLLLPDGTVMAQRTGGNTWYRLTPNNGSYVDGTWTTRAPMVSTRLYYSSAVLRDGRVLVAGAEYGNGWNTAEIYDPASNSWTPSPVPASLITQNNNPQPPSFANTAGFTDSICKILPNGYVLVAPNNPTTPSGSLIFNPFANTWSAGPIYLGSQNEASWVKLPDDSILTIDKNTSSSERFIPSLNVWTNDANVPVSLYDAISELGAALLLPNGKAFFLGANGKTAIYTPTGTVAPGQWVAGPIMPNGAGCSDAAAAMIELNGKILCAAGPFGGFAAPTSFYEYDYLDTTTGPNGSFTQVSSPTGGFTDTNFPPGQTNTVIPYQTIMLALPDGSILYSDCTTNLYTYVPTGFPRITARPAISSITAIGNGSYHLIGTRLNGLSEGASYGDDAQMDSNYPLVRITDGSGNVLYLPTYNWSSTGVQTGNKPVSTEFFAFQGLSPGVGYSLVAVANGIASDPVTFYGPVWVDLNSGNPFQFGSYDFPYHTLAQGISAVPATGTINFKTSGTSSLPVTISKAMTIVATGGPVTIGQ